MKAMVVLLSITKNRIREQTEQLQIKNLAPGRIAEKRQESNHTPENNAYSVRTNRGTRNRSSRLPIPPYLQKKMEHPIRTVEGPL